MSCRILGVISVTRHLMKTKDSTCQEVLKRMTRGLNRIGFCKSQDSFVSELCSNLHNGVFKPSEENVSKCLISNMCSDTFSEQESTVYSFEIFKTRNDPVNHWRSNSLH